MNLFKLKSVSPSIIAYRLVVSTLFLLLSACGSSSSSPTTTFDVDLGDDFSVKPGESVELTAQTTPQNTQVSSYEWVQISGPTVPLAENNIYFLQFTTPDIGGESDVLEFEVIANDIQGEQATDAILITILATDTDTGTFSVELSWDAPTENEDGSQLTNLAGYKIYYGKSATTLDNVVLVNDPLLTSYTIEELSPNQQYFFSMSAFNSSGYESEKTDIVDINL